MLQNKQGYDKLFKKTIDFIRNLCIMDMSSQEIVDNADWCNGSTADSDSVSRGSSPLSVVPWQGHRIP